MIIRYMENKKTQPFDLEPTKKDTLGESSLKSYPLDQIVDEHIGQRGTPERERFERDFEEGMKIITPTTPEDFLKKWSAKRENWYGLMEGADGDDFLKADVCFSVISEILSDYQKAHKSK